MFLFLFHLFSLCRRLVFMQVCDGLVSGLVLSYILLIRFALVPNGQLGLVSVPVLYSQPTL